METSSFFDTRIKINPTTLRAIRIAKSVSCRTLAKACKISEYHIWSWEKGERSPRLRDILNICRLFKCSPRSLQADPRQLIRKQLMDIALSETMSRIEQLSKGEKLGLKQDELIKLVERLGLFDEDDFEFVDQADLLNEAHNQVKGLVP